MIRTTIAYVTSAVVGLGAAWAARPLPAEPIVFEDTGTPFFPDFDAPSEATRLEVHAWSDEASQVKSFAVAFEDGRWVIPTHHNYPADAVERMGKAAGSFVGLRKDIFISDLEADHAEFGLLSPEALDGEAKARGTRVRLEEASGKALVDLILGKRVPGKSGYRYLRRADSNRVYASAIDVDLSTRFEDWIDRELLDIETGEIVALELHPYHVDEATGRLRGDDPKRFEFRKLDDASTPTWVEVEPDPNSKGERPNYVPAAAPRGRELDPSMVRAVLRAIDQLKIVGVRAQPQPLTPRALEKKGFFLTQDLRQLFGNEGHLSVTTRDGVTLTLYFGEVSHESGLALTAGLEQASDEGQSSSADDSAHRYMFVSAEYRADNDERTHEEREAQDQKGEARANAMNQRFASWFYVVANDSFEQMRKAPEDFYKAR